MLKNDFIINIINIGLYTGRKPRQSRDILEKKIEILNNLPECSLPEDYYNAFAKSNAVNFDFDKLPSIVRRQFVIEMSLYYKAQQLYREIME